MLLTLLVSICHVNILIQDIIFLIEAFCVFHLCTLYMIGLPTLWYTVSMNIAQKLCCTPYKNCLITPLPPHNSQEKVVVVESFDCINLLKLY